MSYYILFNPLAGGGASEEKATLYAEKVNAKDSLYNVMNVDYKTLFTDSEADIILFGGDGTVNRFVNDTAGLNLPNKVFIYPLGTGNDFMNDLGIKPNDETVEITKYLKRLPVCEIDGKKSYFINGVGFGVDGYCCEEGDRQKEAGKKDINYTGIAIKGVLGKFKARDVKVTVDGEAHEFKDAWIAPVMWGRYYGGGMNATPDQIRDNEEGTLSVLIFHGKSKLKTLILFPSIFKGKHLKNKKRTAVFSGKEIIVEYAEPCSAQIDGETVLNVKCAKYTAAQPVVAFEQPAEANA